MLRGHNDRRVKIKSPSYLFDIVCQIFTDPVSNVFKKSEINVGTIFPSFVLVPGFTRKP